MRSTATNTHGIAAQQPSERIRAHFSSVTVEWETPQALFNELAQAYGGFDLDPCATANNAKCQRFFTIAENGLRQTWSGKVFMNPPYGRHIGQWVRKAWENP